MGARDKLGEEEGRMPPHGTVVGEAGHGSARAERNCFFKKKVFIVVLGVRPHSLDKCATLGAGLWGDLWVYLRGEVLPLPHRVSILKSGSVCLSPDLHCLLSGDGKGVDFLVPTHQGVRLHQVRHQAHSDKMDFGSPEPRLTLEQ